MGVESVTITKSGVEIAKELCSVANEITIPDDLKLKRKSVQETTNGQESDKQLTCHSE